MSNSISDNLLALLRCPETQSSVQEMEAEALANLNQRITQGNVTDRSGRKIKTKLESALVNESRTLVYPILNSIPTLLIDEAIEYEGGGE